jgi:hypothetical protein
MTPVLSKSVLCLVAVECSATCNCWFSSLVSLMCSEVLVDVTATLSDVHLTTGTWYLVNTRFLSLKLSVFDGIESGCRSVESFLYCVDVMFLQ